MLTKQDINWFNQLADEKNIIEIWVDRIRNMSKEELISDSQFKLAKARGAFMRLMASEANDGSDRYRTWAGNKVLGIHPQYKN